MASTPDSNCWEYHHTEGKKIAWFDSQSQSCWSKITSPNPGITVFEKLDKPTEADRKKDHILVHGISKLEKEQGKAKICDSVVPVLQEKADRWDSVTRKVPGFTEQMLLTADLMHETDYYLTSKLNGIMGEMGLKNVEHVMQALHRLHDKYKMDAEKQDTRIALQEFFKEQGLTGVETTAVMNQWPTCLDWMKKRATVAHPFGTTTWDETSLNKLKSDIESDEGFVKVRAAVIFMLNAAVKKNKEQFWHY